MKKIPLLGLCLVISAVAFAQSKGDREVYLGNKAYQAGDLKSAVTNYEQALKENPTNNIARINLAIAQSKLQAADASVKNFDEALKANKENPDLEARLNYDKGVTLAKNKKYQEAVEAFKKALLTHPEDNNARENLQKALNELKKNEDKKDQNKQDQDKNKDQNKDQQQQPKQNQQQQDQQQQQPSEQKMTKEQADKLLQALRNQERNTRQKLQKKNGVPPPVTEEDW